jgi:hypothetical protein
MAILTAHPTVNTNRMTWVPKERLFVVESSDIGPMTRVYDDACDVGLTLQSQRGFAPIVFVVEHEERRDGEVLYWDLKPANLSMRLKVRFGVRVYND